MERQSKIILVKNILFVLIVYQKTIEYPGLFLESKNYLKKGFVSFPKFNQFWDWNVSKNHKFYSSLESFKSKLPLEIDSVDFEERKWSFELFNTNYYGDSYFQIVTENQFLSYEDQLSFTEKIWKPITNLQPFILNLR